MRISLVVGILLSLVISCQRIDGSKPNITGNTELKQVENASPIAYCFFKLDDKYSTENDPLIINKWLKRKSDLILKNKSIDNIFNHNGGGPNGAEWNPSTDLYIAILSPSIAKGSAENHQLFMNTKVYEQKILAYSPDLIWYNVKQDFWEDQLRTIDPSDIAEMYSNEFLEDIKTGSFEPVTELNYGEIIKFEVLLKSDTVSYFFHAAYGE